MDYMQAHVRVVGRKWRAAGLELSRGSGQMDDLTLFTDIVMCICV